MDNQQFDTYVRGLAEIEQRRHQERAEDNANRGAIQVANVLRNKIKSLIQRITTCDGSSTEAVRNWMREVDMALEQVGNGHIIEAVSSTVSGPLRWETEQQHVQRAAVPWPALRDHLQRSFLHTDEAAALRDEVERTRQSAYEPDAAYSRRFREVADAAYPANNRNDDQNRIIIRA